MRAAVTAVEYHLPEGALDNETLSCLFEGWTAAKIAEKTGINQRRIAAPGECASDLAARAAERVFASGVCTPHEVDYLLLCTQSPDYLLPTTACTLQERLGLKKTAGALDFNLGCSGFVYGLGLAKGLIETGQSRRVLLLTADTYTKYIHPGDKSVRTLFGDAAAATLVEAVPDAGDDLIGPFAYGTDGSGRDNLIVPTGGSREAYLPDAPEETDASGNARTRNHLFMNGGEIFSFTLQAVPDCIGRLTHASGKSLDEVDLFVFHQANGFMLEHLRKKLKVPAERFYVSMSDCGNTVSSTIPIALKRAQNEGRLQNGQLVMLVGFGVGYSWGATLIRWRA